MPEKDEHWTVAELNAFNEAKGKPKRAPDTEKERIKAKKAADAKHNRRVAGMGKELVPGGICEMYKEVM